MIGITEWSIFIGIIVALFGIVTFVVNKSNNTIKALDERPTRQEVKGMIGDTKSELDKFRTETNATLETYRRENSVLVGLVTNVSATLQVFQKSTSESLAAIREDIRTLRNGGK